MSPLEGHLSRHSCSRHQGSESHMAQWQRHQKCHMLQRTTQALCELTKDNSRDPWARKGGLGSSEVPEIFVVRDQVRNSCLSKGTLCYSQPSLGKQGVTNGSSLQPAGEEAMSGSQGRKDLSKSLPRSQESGS
uniref:Uncharacterized protein n=1 Tax=Molossus molossus TaxID=27622 RepID=A0A7J8DTY8_MOLMO|nr:hypothetical protein HJG59_009186 [Molossus molossus]